MLSNRHQNTTEISGDTNGDGLVSGLKFEEIQMVTVYFLE